MIEAVAFLFLVLFVQAIWDRKKIRRVLRKLTLHAAKWFSD
ncbi:hypothetical protein ACUL41_00880 [Virgibacillus natechei]